MPRLPQSARARRRLLRGGVVGGVVVAVVLAVVLIPSHRTPNPDATGKEGPAQLAAATTGHISRADRRAIDSTLDRFFPAGCRAQIPAVAWDLAGPELKSGGTLAAWQAGNSPIPYYPVLEKSFHTWRTIDVGPRYVVFNLLVHAQPAAHLASYVFSGEMVKQGKRWLVNRIYTIAIMNPVTKTTHEVGPRRFLRAPAHLPDPERKVHHLPRDRARRLDPRPGPTHPNFLRRHRAAPRAPLAAHGPGRLA